jgi:translin
MSTSDAVKEASDRLAELEKKRNTAIESSRTITRKTKNMIHAIHVGNDHRSIADELRKDVDRVRSELSGEPSVFYSAVLQDALGEYAEAFIFAAAVGGEDVPSFDSLKITPQAWVMGLADSIGEMRRMVLTYLIEGDLEKARELFGRMESIGDDVLGFDVPDAIAPIRKKQDVARSIIEKTRSDITNAVIMSKK